MTAPNDIPTCPRPARQVVVLVVFLMASLGAGGIGSLLQGSEVDVRYLALDLPAWAPPPWAFGVVWPVLYVLIGVAPWQLWRAGPRPLRVPLALWAVQLGVNAVWPGVFFGLEAFWLAAAVIIGLVGLVIATIASFARQVASAAWLLVPYLLWIAYATALNVAIAAAN